MSRSLPIRSATAFSMLLVAGAGLVASCGPQTPAAAQPAPTTPTPCPTTPQKLQPCTWGDVGTSTQVFFEPKAGSLCFVKSTTGSKIDIHTTLRAGNPAANDACIKGPAPRYIGAVESTETMLARKMGNDEILCKHGQGADQPAKWACDCAP